jgi:AcrR family transcriptional regulator
VHLVSPGVKQQRQPAAPPRAAGRDGADGADGAVGGLDGRTERWREYRAARREQLIDATIAALVEHGPDASMEQIAATAGIAKPRLYRHFADRNDLVDAVASRVAQLIIAGLAASIDPAATVRGAVRDALDAFFGLVEQNPNLFKFLIDNATPHAGHGNAIIENARAVASLFISIASADLQAADVSSDGAEPLAHALIGAVLGATDWWLMQPVESRMPRDRLVGHLCTVVVGAADASLKTVGLTLSPDASIMENHFLAVEPTLDKGAQHG